MMRLPIATEEPFLSCIEPQTVLHPSDGLKLADQLFRERRFEEAQRLFIEVANVEPDNFHAAHGAGLTFTELKRHADAVYWYDRAGNICMTELMLCTLNKAVSLGERGYSAEGVALLDGLLRTYPDHAHALYNRGVLKMQMDLFAESLNDFNRSLEIDPDCANGDARFCKGFANLVLGNYEDGFNNFEHRLKDNIKGGPSQGDELKPEHVVCVHGLKSAVHGKTILVLSEMGNGDMIMFGRYLPLLVKLGAKVFVVVHAGVAPLFTGHHGIEIWPEDAELPAADYWCHMMGLAWVFQTRTHNVPPPLPIHYDETISRRWQKTIPPDGVLNVGLCWAGALISRYDEHRSIPLAMLKPLTDLAAGRKIRFFGLQQSIRACDADAADELPILNFGTRLTDFRQTSHAMKLLDLVITVDTSVAHLAGTIGIPTWIMTTKFRTYWLWLKGRNDTPWYPSVELIRQTTHGDWSGAISVARDRLEAMLALT